jgi:hypothetical protein
VIYVTYKEIMFQNSLIIMKQKIKYNLRDLHLICYGNKS